MRKLLLLLATAFACFSMAIGQHYQGVEASELVPGAKHVWMDGSLKLPKFIRFADGQQPDLHAVEDFIASQFDLIAGVESWALLRSDNDQLGHRHDRYQQYYMGYPVEGSMVIVHSNNGKVYSINGEYYKMTQDISSGASFAQESAFEGALEAIDAKLYKWEIPGEESFLQRMHEENPVAFPNDTWFPEAELVIAPKDGNFKETDFRLAYKFDIYAQIPLQRKEVFIDAQTGEYLCEFNLIHTADSAGTADTQYSGTRDIITDNFMGSFRLRESGRGNGVRTWNMQGGTNYGNAVDFVDNDNDWDFAGAPAIDRAASDAHWGAEMTYDYYDVVHSRNSIDANGFQLNSYVNYDQNFNNAFWDGVQMTYGDGSGSPFTALDIAGHEITHGLTTFSANLVYQNESGALNESFSDIFGKAVEYYARPNNFSWRIGEDVFVIRNMQDPGANGDPRNYLGDDWFTGAGDNGGVHVNSGVQNHWFYLLVEGDQGVNDFGDNYSVDSIGWDSAGAVAFRNLTVYLTRNSEYFDAQFFSIQSAMDLYGACSRVHEAVVNAWHAVGIGDPFSPIAVSDFDAFSTELCSAPYEVQFIDQSLTVANYRWDFGDGDTSNVSAPSHEYTTPGTYTVTLEIDGLCGGGDTAVKTNFITINAAPDTAVVSAPAPVICRSQAMLQGTGSGDIHWYDSNDNLLDIGNSYQTDALTSNTTFRVRNIDVGTPQNAGPADNNFGQGGFHNTGFEARLNFDVFTNCRLVSAFVYPGSAGTRNFVLEDDNGNVVQTVSVNIPNTTPQRVQLNFDLSPGSYRVGGENMDLFRHNGGASYPYDLTDVLSITGSSAGPGNYYYLYDWEVSEVCSSLPVEVSVEVDPITAPTGVDKNRCGTGAVTLSATHPAGGTIYWFDANGNEVGSGSSFTTPSLTATTNYFAEARVGANPVNVGPEDGAAVGGGGYFNNGFPRGIFFTAFVDIHIKSAWVDAGSPGPRDIIVEDAQGNPVLTKRVNIPAGQGRITLDIDLPAGSYFIGGSDMDLFRNNDGANYPYVFPGLVELTGSNATRAGFYYFLYDWEVEEAPCVSARVPVQAIVSPGTGPGAQFIYSSAALNVIFSNQATGSITSYSWDFGDGNTSNQPNPTHGYARSGQYTVRLETFDGNCYETSSQDINLIAVSTDPREAIGLSLYPNPGNGDFVLSASLPTSQPLNIDVFDMMGKRVHSQYVDQASRELKLNVNLPSLAPGSYLVQLRGKDGLWSTKYLKQ